MFRFDNEFHAVKFTKEYFNLLRLDQESVCSTDLNLYLIFDRLNEL